MKIFHLLYAAFFFFFLPFLVYQAAAFYTDQYFRSKLIPYPSEKFALVMGLGACFFSLGISFVIHGVLFNKKGSRS